MQTLNTLFERELTKLVQEDIETLREQIAAGLLSHEDYKFRCGQISGLQCILKLCETANENLSKR